MDILRQYILIDDDKINNMICKHIIRQALGKETIMVDFTLASSAIDYIKSRLIEGVDIAHTIILLDIHMPEINGWDTLELLNELEDVFKDKLTVFMLSSTIDPHDIHRALQHPLVCDFIEKPLTIEKFNEVVAGQIEEHCGQR